MPNCLVVYYYTRPFPLRASVRDHLDCFGRYSGHRCFYFNAGWRRDTRWLESVPFDLVVFHTSLLCTRWKRSKFQKLMHRLRGLKNLDAVKVALPQDEFISTDLLCEFIREFGVDHVYSAAPPSEWSRIYPSVDRGRVSFHQVLTGYLDDRTLSRIEALAGREQRRSIDVGYRAWRAPAWLGRHGIKKAEIAQSFRAAMTGTDLVADISTAERDTLFGDDWYRFLLRCKYTIGVEGGASLLDFDGSTRTRTEAYCQAHPNAGFDEIAAACFPGQDGNLRLFAISPRHLEACATRSCQVLVRGEYNGVLEAGKHYIEVDPDLANLPEVIDEARNEQRRQEIVEQAYRDVVASGRYSYRKFVELVLDSALPDGNGSDAARQTSSAASLGYTINRVVEAIGWCGVAIISAVSYVYKSLKRRIG